MFTGTPKFHWKCRGAQYIEPRIRNRHACLSPGTHLDCEFVTQAGAAGQISTGLDLICHDQDQMR